MLVFPSSGAGAGAGPSDEKENPPLWTFPQLSPRTSGWQFNSPLLFKQSMITHTLCQLTSQGVWLFSIPWHAARTIYK